MVLFPTPLIILALVEASERTFSEAVVLNCRLIVVSDDRARVVVAVDLVDFATSVSFTPVALASGALTKVVNTPDVEANTVVTLYFLNKSDRFVSLYAYGLLFEIPMKHPPFHSIKID